ncbi:hypothetical protein ACFSJ3_09140 [Corallincola platygyrae]|uniref:Uncharacterized protein n=1 Tax=Corallincola platygyrae TaxID=1193278 RepID=A0ABW4XNU9_9GAMM
MAYDFGSLKLGIKNPFKLEGLVNTLAGIAIVGIGLGPLLSVASVIQEDKIRAWIYALLGLFLLIVGLRRAGMGLFQLFRFFVGRSVPTSLSYNCNPSEQDNAKAEHRFTAYNAKQLESMLMGRKNTTFVEPQGWLARLLHSLVPKLITAPYPLRNLAQELFTVVAMTATAFIAFGIASFVCATGLAGAAGNLIMPLMSVMLLVYITLVWRSTGGRLKDGRLGRLQAKGPGSLARLLAFAILVPVLIGYGYGQLNLRPDEAVLFNQMIELVSFNAWPNLTYLLVMVAVVLASTILLFIERMKLTQAHTDVSEYRDNLQESIHPNEIFINTESIVLANRRYQEIPNRSYQAFDPKLNEQSEGKGAFDGQLLIETQPEFKELPHSALFKLCRTAATIVGQTLLVIGLATFAYVVMNGYDIYLLAENVFQSDLIPALRGVRDDAMALEIATPILLPVTEEIDSLIVMLFLSLASTAAGNILARGAHLFWGEMHWDSLLMWMKMEGTYTESKVSTGMSIHDSTRSENVVVRSSITPWIISSRIRTTCFATSGSNNLEMPRYVLDMQKNDAELNEIVGEIKDFLRGRENIASITNENDLANAKNIYDVNQVSRAHLSAPQTPAPGQHSLEEQAAHHQRQEALEKSD